MSRSTPAPSSGIYLKKGSVPPPHASSQAAPKDTIVNDIGSHQEVQKNQQRYLSPIKLLAPAITDPGQKLDGKDLNNWFHPEVEMSPNILWPCWEIWNWEIWNWLFPTQKDPRSCEDHALSQCISNYWLHPLLWLASLWLPAWISRYQSHCESHVSKDLVLIRWNKLKSLHSSVIPADSLKLSRVNL